MANKTLILVDKICTEAEIGGVVDCTSGGVVDCTSGVNMSLT